MSGKIYSGRVYPATKPAVDKYLSTECKNPLPTANPSNKAKSAWGVIRSFVSILKESTVCGIVVFSLGCLRLDLLSNIRILLNQLDLFNFYDMNISTNSGIGGNLTQIFPCKRMPLISFSCSENCQ